MSGDLELSRELTRVIASIEAVTDVFPSGSPLQLATHRIASLGASVDLDDAKVAVSRTKNAFTLCVTIGVNASQPVLGTIRTVSDAIRNYMLIAGLDPSPDIEVTVSYIEWRPEPRLHTGCAGTRT